VAWGAPADLHDVVALARGHRLTWEVETMPLDAASEAHERLRAGHVTGRLVLVP
jgi:propanol-preferring alcohol dehydrogenase